MVEHTVFVQEMGGAVVLTCQELGINNIEFPYDDFTGDNIKKTILKYKYLNEADANFDIAIVDNRQPQEDFNLKKARESKELNKNHNRL